MKLNAGKVLLLAVTAALATGCGQQVASTASSGNAQPLAVKNTAATRYVAVFKSETLPADAATRVQTAGGRLVKKLDQIGTVTFIGTATAASRLSGDSAILAVSPERQHSLPAGEQATPDDVQVPTPATDSYLPRQWDMRRIGAPAVWARVPTEVQAKSTVAVLDTGVMDTHPDLLGKVTYSKATNYCQEPGDANTSPAYPIYTKWINFDSLPTGDDPCSVAPSTMYVSHGTHVAGTIAAKVGGGKVVGVGPGLNIAAYKVFDRFTVTQDGEVIDDVSGWDGPIWEAMIDAAVHGFDAINMSLGGTAYRNNQDDNASIVAWNRVAKLTAQLGTTIVSSAGNAAQDANGPATHIPGDLPSIINVSATGTSQLVNSGGMLNAAPGSDVIAFYSNYGAAVDISAPGGDCGPTYPTGCAAPYLILNAGIDESAGSKGAAVYYYMAGTSMATPHVAATAALIRALHKDWSPAQVRAQLTSTATNVGDRQHFGLGILNADAAVR